MPYNVSKFAKNHLHQSGWTEGKGLGRNEDGMSEAIKVKIKADNAGIGHDPAEQFTFHWWEHAFSKSAQNIKVTESDAGVEVATKSETEKASTRKQNKQLLKKKLLYGSFVKSGVLEHGEIQKSSCTDDGGGSSDSELENINASKALTDAELLAACGGRTAHKGARHGVNLSGKLARLQEQEGDSLDSGTKKKKKKCKKEKKESQLECAPQHPVTVVLKNEGPLSEKPRKKKKRKKDDSKLEDCEASDVVVADSERKKQKKLKQKKPNSEEEGVKNSPKSELKVKKKKRKRKISLTEMERKD